MERVAGHVDIHMTDGLFGNFRETIQQESNGATRSHTRHSLHCSHSTRDSVYTREDEKEEAPKCQRGKQSPTALLVGTESKGSKVCNTKYFVIKSLNYHNIDKSVENGIWATQAMNEPVLNESFKTAHRVILVFSVNMSGHFQGYAQMTSPIGERRANVWSEVNKGANPWGGSFCVDWLRLYDLPFRKTVHLKNSLNFFKPVKISRDCQELPEDLGQALCALIDEGAVMAGRSKRKGIGRDGTAISLKRRWKESAGLPDTSKWRRQVADRCNDVARFPVTYASRSLSSTPGAGSHASRGLLSEATSCPLESWRASRSQVHYPSSESSMDRDHYTNRERRLRWTQRPLERNAITDWTNSSSNSRSADLPAEEDLLNMTYEDYLHRHEHCMELSTDYQQGPGLQYLLSPGYGSRSKRNSRMGSSEDQYA